MTEAKKIGNLLAVVSGFVSLGAALILGWNRLITLTDLGIAAGMYLPTAIGVTVGFHRLLAHRAFQTYRPIKYLLAILGSMAVQGPVVEWVSDHRKHHAYADREGDPHSPHVGYGGGWQGAFRGFWHAHIGWVLRTQGEAEPSIYSRDLLLDHGIVFIDRFVGVFIIFTFLLPFVLGIAFTGKLHGGLTALFWGGFVRVFLMHHSAFSVNSICHFFGARRFEVNDRSGNVLWLSLLSLGESWHHNHHAFPSSAFHGLRWWEFDLSGLFIRVLRSVGLAWNVVEVPVEIQAQREIATAHARW